MNGIIVVNKEQGYTSRDIVNILNKKFNTKKIGHTGTLDPLATGVLVVCVGKYTRLVDKITMEDKEYVATIKLGLETDTLDITGNVINKEKVSELSYNQVQNVLESFLGSYLQEVPKYSAVKINGKKLYEYARNNEEVVLPKREIEIYEIELLDLTKEEIKFRCVVSKGTYIRSLIKDICLKLNVLGTMSSLERTRQGIFKIDNSYTIDEIKNDGYKLLDINDIFSYPHYEINEEEYQKVLNGGFLKFNRDDEYLMLDFKNQTVAIYQNEGEFFRTYFRL